MALDTHGRWPWVAAAAALPVGVASVSKPGLRPLAALLLHQTEEWVWPGGFLPWINRKLFDGGEDEFPIDRRTGFAINVALGWSVSLAALAGPRAAGPAALLYVSHVANAGMHVGWAVRHRRYDPGLVTAVTTLLPVAAVGGADLLRDAQTPRRTVAAGAVLGALTSAALPVTMRRRIRRRAAAPAT